MSYPAIPGQGGYYDTNQTRRPTHSSARSTSTTQYAPAVTFANGSQPQYASSAYDVQSQNQYDYAQSNQPAYKNGNDGWRDGNLQQDQYGYMRDSTNSATQAAAENVSYSNRPAGGRGSNRSGLNSLGYASGLGSPQLSSLNRQRTTTTSAQSVEPEHPINRVRSPLQGMQQQQQYQSACSTYLSGTYQQPSNACALQQSSLAEALAGAVSRKNQQSAANMQSQAPQRSASPYVAAPTHKRGASAQDQRAISSPNMSKQRAPAVNARHSEVNSRQGSSAIQPKSISNLVTAPPPVTDEVAAQDAMPAYIDPSQVFNPYQREHERRRKEVAEDEARRKQEEAQRKEEEEKKRAEEEVEKRAPEAAAAEAAKTKLSQKKAPSRRTLRANKKKTTAAVPEATSPPVETDMAMQMKLMMDKMKEFRQQDPAKFQKLWNDMRKGSSNAGTAPASSSAPAAAPRNSQAPGADAQPSIGPATSTPQPQSAPVSAAEPLAATRASKKESRPPLQHPPGADPSVPLNGYKVVLENNPEGLPDLGRFPAERRIRAGYHKEPGDKVERAPKTPMPSGPVPMQPLPPNAVGGGVESPKDKREALAKSAITALRADPANVAIEITAQDINIMLDQNPNYIDLCDMLEKKGLKFHRGHFARQLLASVPDLTRAQQQESSPAVPPAVSQHISQPAMNYPPHQPPHLQGPPGAPTFGVLTPAIPGPTSGPGLSNGQPPASTGTPGSLFQAAYTVPYLKQEVKKPSKGKPLTFAKPEPPPGSKEAMARKRDFSELVDLTQLSDNDDYVLSSEQPRAGSPSPGPDLLRQFQLPMNGTSQRAQATSMAAFVPGIQNMAYPPPQAASYPSTPPHPPKKPKTILARAVNKGEALAKEYYDPKTVARDIMIAAGRHPTERPLNAHMAGLLGVHIELDSDLNTFDWDAIDPGGPSAPKVAYVDIPAGPPRYRLGAKVHTKRRQGERKVEDKAGEMRLPDSAKRDPPSASVPVPVPVPAPASSSATTSPAPFAPLNHCNNQRKEDKLPSEPRPSRLRESLARTPERSSNPNKRKASADPLDAPAPHAKPPSTPRASSRPPSRSSNMDTGSGSRFPSGKRRGRPPGSKNKHPGLSAMSQSAKATSSVPRIEVPLHSPSPQSHSVYRCKWMRCKDELHNLETLRKHIRKKHQPSGEDLEQAKPFECWWKHCPTKGPGGTYLPTHAYDNIDEWMNHMYETHVHEVAMKLGDGPNTTPADAHTLAAVKARFLSDKKGRLVTPAITPEQNEDLPTDTWIMASIVSHKGGKDKSKNSNHDYNDNDYEQSDDANGRMVEANVHAQNAFFKTHRQRGERGPIGAKVAAEETLKAMERHKRDVGVGLDRGGCTLVNEARRSTFVHAPGVRREVDDDY